MSRITLRQLNGCVGTLLVAAYTYYFLDENIMSDEDYDAVSKFVAAHYDKITHPHKSFIPHDVGVGGSVFNVPENAYPLVVVSAAYRAVNKPMPSEKIHDRAINYVNGYQVFGEQKTGTLDDFFS